MSGSSPEENSAARSSVPYGQACAGCSKAKCRCISRGAHAPCERCHRLRQDCLPSRITRKRTLRRPATQANGQLEEKLDRLVTLLSSQHGAREPGQQASPAVVSPQPVPSVSTQHELPSRMTPVFPVPAPAIGPAVLSTQAPSLHNPLPAGPALTADDELLMNFRQHHLKVFPFMHIPLEMR
jgi:hypothetical protein